ncbi:MAG: GAP family protein [Flavobacteriaceae bacterium]
MNGLSIIPLAITVILGPQITVAILLLTQKNPIKNSVSYILGITFGITCLTSISYLFLSYYHIDAPNPAYQQKIKVAISIILIYLMIKNFLNKNKLTKKPKWMQSLQNASLKSIFLIGFGLVLFMPADIGVALSVGGVLVAKNQGLAHALPLFITVMILISSPLDIYLILGKRGPKLMEKVNKWINNNGWVINEIVYMMFIYLIWS